MSKIRDNNIDELFSAILLLRNIDECYMFFEDICTVAELQEMSRRLLAAKMLNENIPYNEITAKTGLSTATISRVNRCLRYGADGYKLVLERLAEQKEKEEK